MDSREVINRRHYYHRTGNHAYCKPDRDCRAEELRAMAIDSDAEIPIELTRGAKLFNDLKDGLGPETLVLLEEAARIADRLDRLDAILIGSRKQWMHFRMREDGDVNVILTGALAESRQQASVLGGLMRDIRAVKNASSNTPANKNGKAGGLLDDDGPSDELAPRRRGTS